MTGGGPPPKPPSETSDKIINILASDSILIGQIVVTSWVHKRSDKANFIQFYEKRGLNEFENVVLHAEKMIEIAQTIGDKESEMYGHQEMGNAFLYFARYDDVIDCGKKCLKMAQEIDSTEGMMNAYCRLMVAYRHMQKHDDTILYAHKLLDCAMKNNDQKAMMMNAYSKLGQAHLALKHYQDAADFVKKCIEIAREIEERRVEVKAYLVMGQIYNALSDYDNGIIFCNKCIELAISIGDKVDEANAYRFLGVIYYYLQKYDDAIQNFKKCINMAQETGEKKIEAQAYLGLASVYHRSVDKESIDKAIKYGKKCLDISQEIGDKKTEMDGHYCLAHTHMDSMQLNEVSQSIDAGMAIATELGDKEAEENFKETSSIFYGCVGLVDKRSIPSVNEFLEVPTCSEDELLQDLDQAFKEVDVSCSVNLFCIREMGNFYHSMGQNNMAVRCFKEGLPTAESCSDTGQLSQFYYGFGQLLCSLNRELNVAEHYLRKAIRCFEAIFTALGSLDEFKISIFDKYVDSYKLLAILLTKDKQIEEAVLVLDRCRARALKDLMMSNFKMEQEKSNDEHLEYSDVLSLVSRNDFSIAFYSLCFGAFLKFFVGGETNLHYSGCLNHSLQIDVDTLFDEMGVREVVDCENRSLDKEEDIQKEQRRSQEEYEELNQATALLLNENSAETKGSTLEALFKILKCERILSSKQDEVVIIPEGPLYQVPFPALRDPRTEKYLSETKRIRLAPSLATLKALQERTEDYYSKKGALIVGNPLVGKVMFDGEEK
ncbi:tetratricopeptide repeat protein 28-like, partial [Actinia tenebrosa]|uniref:Tetratricopeptide repeat protein 28-like n=1 Tax=Actinia tenebrosa TaxID=6105 RepID=A0A6P8HTA3_ACTTE